MINLGAIATWIKDAGRQVDTFLDSTLGVKHKRVRQGLEAGALFGVLQGFYSGKGARLKSAVIAGVVGALMCAGLGAVFFP